MDKVLEDLEMVKIKYMEQGPKFTGRGELFADIAMSIITKASDYLVIS